MDLEWWLSGLIYLYLHNSWLTIWNLASGVSTISLGNPLVTLREPLQNPSRTLAEFFDNRKAMVG
jgi:hypothetical protein